VPAPLLPSLDESNAAPAAPRCVLCFCFHRA
jgi:hypothetical protein